MLRVEYLRADVAAERFRRGEPGLLGVVGFPALPEGCAAGVPSASVACASLLPQGREAAFCEVWLSDSPVQGGIDGAIRFATCGDFLFGVFTAPERAGETRATARRAYAQMFAMAGRQGFAHFLRFWNYVPRINEDEGGMERYRLFNLGRGDAFEAAGRHRETIPAACALGTDSGNTLTVYFVAAREPGRAVENPRQVSAYRYPPEHGPHSPTFSRAVLHGAGDAARLFVSGTASIVGHATLHAGDVVAQTRETLANLRAVFAEANRIFQPGSFDKGRASYKVYVRRPADAQAVADELAAALGEGADASFLRADICRRDLLVEIEAIAYGSEGGAQPRP